MLTFEITTGTVYHNGKVLGHGYSGHGPGVNNPTMTEFRSVGPIPVGRWLIHGPPFFSEHAGPYCLHLIPKPGTLTFGRSGFLVHGDSIRSPGAASRGCIVVARTVRMAMWESGDRDLEVVASCAPEVPPSVA